MTRKIDLSNLKYQWHNREYKMSLMVEREKKIKIMGLIRSIYIINILTTTIRGWKKKLQEICN